MFTLLIRECVSGYGRTLQLHFQYIADFLYSGQTIFYTSILSLAFMSKNRASWTQTQLNDALLAINSGTMHLATASKHYDIPRRTLRDYVSKDSNVKKKVGRGFTLSDEQREELNFRIKRLAEIGYPITLKILRLSVYKYCEEKELKHNFSQKTMMAGYKWAKTYLKNNPSISIRKAQNLNPARAQKLNKTVVNEHFAQFKRILEKNKCNGNPAVIWNMDEKGCRLTMHSSQPVLAQKGARRVHVVGNEHGENVTIVSCGNAAGNFIPPMIIFKGKRQKPEWSDDLPAGSLVKMSEKGSMTQAVFQEWLHHFAKYKNQGVSILIIDGAKCHLSYEIVVTAEQLGIVLYCLPSNTTHELQPMDKAVFRSFEYHWSDELSKYWFNNLDRVLTKQRFSKVFTPTWHRSMTPQNIISGFRATGLYPYNPSAIPEEAYKPSEVTFQKFPSENQSVDSNNQPGPSNINDANGAIVEPELDMENSESGSEDKITFHSLLPSPVRKKPRVVNRKKSLNSHAVVLTKELFLDSNQTTSEMSSTNLQKESNLKNSTKKKTGNNHSSVNDTGKRNGKRSIQSGSVKKNCKRVKRSSTLLRDEAWFCKVCLEDWVKDMRKCVSCEAYVHEDCVGLTKDDTDEFSCSDCI